MRFTNIIYDNDGVLVDSFHDFFERTIAVARARGWPTDEATLAKITAEWGGPTEIIIGEHWRGLVTPKELERVWREMNKTLVSSLYPQARSTLEAMHLCYLDQHMCTGRGRVSTTHHLGRNGIRGYFSRVITGRDVKAHKPAPDGLNAIIGPYEKLGRTRAEFLFVGDGYKADWEAAQAAKVEFVAVCQAPNASHERFLAAGVPATHIIDDIGELTDWLDRYG
jgi:phosphoglycolate phosphatase-like HAD superfamily hydrolase